MSVRIRSSAHKALRMLITATGKSTLDVISDAILLAAKQLTTVAIVRFRLLDPLEILTLQSEICRIEQLHQDNRRRAKLRFSDKNIGEKAAKIIEKIDAETLELQRLRLRLGKQALVTELVGADVPAFKTLIHWAKNRIEKETRNEERRVHELEFKILKNLFES